MASTLPVTLTPTMTDSDQTYTTRTLETDFGDGYSQRAGDGINTVLTTLNLTWAGPNSDITTLHNHFIERAGYQSFTINASWAPSTAWKWVCKEWSVISLSKDVEQLQATLLRVFDI